MSPSRLFILRPVATSLLMVGLLLVGLVAYPQLPVSALPEVDYPTIQVVTFYPGAESGRHGVVGDGAAGAPVRPGSRAEPDDFDQFAGQLHHYAAVRSRTRISTSPNSRCRPRSTRRTTLSAERSAQPAHLQQGESRRTRPILTLALTSDTLPLSKVEDLADTRLAQKISQLPGVGLVSASAADRSPRCASRRTRRRWPPTA